jgi:hypothetical protein
MKNIIGISLFVAFLLFSGFAEASPCRCAGRLAVTCNTEQRVFANPHSGWVVMPVANQPVCCSSRL